MKTQLTPTKARLTLDGSAELERRLAVLCRQIGQSVLDRVGRHKLDALVLAGGYGRGQGGVLQAGAEDAPYNDLEFYVYLKGNVLLNTHRYRARLNQLSHSLSPGAGLHVEFKIDSIEKLRRAPVSIFSYDLVSGHWIVEGPIHLFRECSHHLDASRIEPSEAARLLLNRCSGLLLAKELLNQPRLTAEQCDFIGRNLAKLELALGDALLAAEGRYHWDCRERNRRLKEHSFSEPTAFVEQVLQHHASGVSFKLHPSRLLKSVPEFQEEHRELTELALQVWLWVENRRLNTRFTTIEQYAFSPLTKCSGTSILKNVLLSLRTFGPGATLDRYSQRYPRERLMNALPLLLGGGEPAAQSQARRRLQQQLHTHAEDWAGFVQAYKRVWSCYG
jgi:hypothetical protein